MHHNQLLVELKRSIAPKKFRNIKLFRNLDFTCLFNRFFFLIGLSTSLNITEGLREIKYSSSSRTAEYVLPIDWICQWAQSCYGSPIILNFSESIFFASPHRGLSKPRWWCTFDTQINRTSAFVRPSVSIEVESQKNKSLVFLGILALLLLYLYLRVLTLYLHLLWPRLYQISISKKNCEALS